MSLQQPQLSNSAAGISHLPLLGSRGCAPSWARGTRRSCCPWRPLTSCKPTFRNRGAAALKLSTCSQSPDTGRPRRDGPRPGSPGAPVHAVPPPSTGGSPCCRPVPVQGTAGSRSGGSPRLTPQHRHRVHRPTLALPAEAFSTCCPPSQDPEPLGPPGLCPLLTAARPCGSRSPRSLLWQKRKPRPRKGGDLPRRSSHNEGCPEDSGAPGETRSLQHPVPQKWPPAHSPTQDMASGQA